MAPPQVLRATGGRSRRTATVPAMRQETVGAISTAALTCRGQQGMTRGNRRPTTRGPDDRRVDDAGQRRRSDDRRDDDEIRRPQIEDRRPDGPRPDDRRIPKGRGHTPAGPDRPRFRQPPGPTTAGTDDRGFCKGNYGAPSGAGQRGDGENRGGNDWWPRAAGRRSRVPAGRDRTWRSRRAARPMAATAARDDRRSDDPNRDGWNRDGWKPR